MALGLRDLEIIIEKAEFHRLIGEVEGQYFDAKGQPYQFSTGTDAKREFAKDVAAFANAIGGCVFIGLATKPAELRPGEEVAEVRPIDRTLFDVDQHRKLISKWLYPPPKGIDVKWVQYGRDPAKGVGVIFVPAQDERSNRF